MLSYKKTDHVTFRVRTLELDCISAVLLTSRWHLFAGLVTSVVQFIKNREKKILKLAPQSGSKAHNITQLGSKITADGDCSHEIKRRLLLGRKVMAKLDSILKSRDVTLSTKVCLVKAMVFPVVMYGCASWTVKKAERQRIDAFELWCWRRLLRVPWTARRSNTTVQMHQFFGAQPSSQSNSHIHTWPQEKP